MAKLYSIYKEWEKQDGKRVKINNLTHTIKVTVMDQRYPYPEKLVDVTAIPLSKLSKYYIETKKQLGDDFVVDVLNGSIEILTDVYNQLEW